MGLLVEVSMKPRSFASIVAVAALACVAGSGVGAQEGRERDATVVYGAGQAPTAEELRQVLFGDSKNLRRSATRGVVMTESAPPAAVGGGGGGGGDGRPSVAFRIEFAFDSAEVPEAYQPHLAAMAEALMSAEAGQSRVRIIGHTDTVGGDAYNFDLSRRRAEATLGQLVGRYGVPASRLEVMGLGESQPLADVPGADSANRRVEFQPL
jgi:outer membrane protein OmpA-like peptidoglycan-associated protein